MWDRIETEWRAFRQRARHEWAKLTDEHLDEIDGRRDRLARRVRDVYGVSDEEADKQVLAWEASLRDGDSVVTRLDSDPSAYPPSTHASAYYNGTTAAAELRNARRDPEPRGNPDTGTSRAGVEGVFENEGPEFGEHDRPGGAGMPGNQGGGRDPGPVGDPHEGTGASSGARASGDVGRRGSPAPGTAGRGSG